MKRVNDLFVAVIGLIVIALTLCIFFLLNFEKTAVSFWALSFMLLSEIIAFIGIWATGLSQNLTNKIFIRSGVTGILLLYLIANVVMSLFSGLFRAHVSLFVLIEIFIIAVVLLAALFIMFFSNRINTSDQKIVSDRKLMQICQKRIYDLMVDSRNKDFEKQLNVIYEKIKFADNIGASSVDEKIVGSVIKLEKQLQTPEINNDEINEIFNELSSFIVVRNMEIAENKRGGF